jgi:hypothetical protein
MWCLRLFSGSDKHRRSARTLPVTPPKPHYPPSPPISTELRNPQKECPLFSPNLPAELRIQIYEAVLGDSDRLMHVIPFNDHSNRVGRRRCDNTNPCDGPTWQHSCFGIVLSPNKHSSLHYRVFESDDQLLALLMTCHRM